jgi:hypothetical protein
MGDPPMGEVATAPVASRPAVLKLQACLDQLVALDSGPLTGIEAFGNLKILCGEGTHPEDLEEICSSTTFYGVRSFCCCFLDKSWFLRCC